ncbi:MAG: histidinol-phosphate transaminase [bacterium]
MIKSPDYIAELKPYVPGKPVEELERELGIKDAVKLASNENPLGPSAKALSMMRSADFHLNRYPDGGGFYLKQKLSEKTGFPEESIILGCGSNELLNLAAIAYLTDKDSAVMATPSFVVYPSATRMVGARAIQVPLTKDFRHDLAAMARAITSDTRIVFIANPNNPTGTMNTAREFKEFMDAVPPGLLVIVDEAYCEYVSSRNYPDSFSFLRTGRDILILRTFSKIYGLAGLRVGYGISKKEIITEIDKVRPPFNTSTIAQAAAIAALDDQAHVQNSIKVNEQGRTYLYAELAKLKVRFVPTETNFIYMKIDNSGLIYNEILKRGVIVRPMGPDAIRVTIGLPEENTKFINALREVMH